MLKPILLTLIVAIIVVVIYRQRNRKVTFATFLTAEMAMWAILIVLGGIIYIVDSVAKAI